MKKVAVIIGSIVGIGLFGLGMLLFGTYIGTTVTEDEYTQETQEVAETSNDEMLAYEYKATYGIEYENSDDYALFTDEKSGLEKIVDNSFMPNYNMTDEIGTYFFSNLEVQKDGKVSDIDWNFVSFENGVTTLNDSYTDDNGDVTQFTARSYIDSDGLLFVIIDVVDIHYSRENMLIEVYEQK